MRAKRVVKSHCLRQSLIMPRLESFSFRGETLATQLIETTEVFPGVVCDAYLHPETKERDLGVIYIEADRRTKPQRVLQGDQTIEGYISGKGELIIKKSSGERLVFEVGPGSEGFAQNVEVGDIMQWRAAEQEGLVVFEVCYPPYKAGRYEDLTDMLL